MEESISRLPKKEKGLLLTINEYPEVGEPCMFVKDMYLSLFCCLSYDTEMEESISRLPKREKGLLLTINEYPAFDGVIIRDRKSVV